MLYRRLCLAARRVPMVVTILFASSSMIAGQQRDAAAPVPNDEAQRQALELVRDIFAQDYQAARTRVDKAGLAERLLDRASQMDQRDAGCFVLLQEARDMAAQAGDVTLALEAVGTLVGKYDVDARVMRQDTLLEVAKSARLTEQRKALAEHSIPSIRAAADNDDYETANRLLDVALAAARRARDGALVKRIVALNKEIDEIETAHAQLLPALAVLKQNATDPEANLAVGRFLCLVRGHWDKGVAMLALGSDDALKALAQKELEGVDTPAEEMALADGWWQLSEQATGQEQKQLQIVAAAHYKRVLPDLSGLTKAKAEKRLAEVAFPVPNIEDIFVASSPAQYYGEKKILIIMDHAREVETAEKACKKYGLMYDLTKNYDMNRGDYSDCHTVISGSNAMDYWGKSDEHKKPKAFQHLGAFVDDGGHLIVLGTYNGRNNHHLTRFGIKTSYYHNNSFEPAGRPTDLLFLGNLHIIPQDRRLTSAGNFSCSAPHTVLLTRGEGSYQGQPALITLNHNKGRVTFTLCEPNWRDDLWLISVLLSWVARGCPTEDG